MVILGHDLLPHFHISSFNLTGELMSDLHQQLLILKEENTKLKEMVNENAEVEVLR